MQTHQNIKDLNIYSDFLRYDFKYLIKILINNKFLFFYTSLISILPQLFILFTSLNYLKEMLDLLLKDMLKNLL